ncbi:Uncharacterised protein [Enterobacter cloacae]|nr:Uncharacterised protein [Enterobacter cloacae]
MSGEFPQLDRVLAGHQRRVARIVRFGVRHITRRVNLRMRRNLQRVVDDQPSLSIAFPVNLQAEEVSFYPCRPHYSGAGNALSVFQRYAAGIDGFNFTV